VDISFFFSPLALDEFPRRRQYSAQSFLTVTEVYTDVFPAWEEAEVVIVGWAEDRGTVGARGAALAPNAIRDHLYGLTAPITHAKVADLGNLIPRDDLDECYEKLAYVLGILLRAGKTVLLLGGSGDLAYGQYLGYQDLEQPIEYVSIDARPDMLDFEIALTNHSHNSAVFTHAPNYLYHYTCLGAQGYFVTEAERKTLKAMNFELVRIGEVRDTLMGDMHLAEPHLRQAHMVSMDMASIRRADAPGTAHGTAAGFTTEEACQLARYVGMGHRASSFSITEANPSLDTQEQTVQLAALLAWFFVEGVYNRVADEPKADRSNLQTYRATLHGTLNEMVFYRSEQTNRWWMEVPSPQRMRGGRGLSVLVPCTHEDYEAALRDEIPERWWTAHYRFQ